MSPLSGYQLRPQKVRVLSRMAHFCEVDQIGYDDEDPEIRHLFEEELAKSRVK